MKRSSILLAFLVVSVVSAFPLAGEAFAQTTTETVLLESAETTTTTTVDITFTEAVDGVVAGTFTVGGATVTTVTGSDGDSTYTLTIADADAFDTDATPLVAFVSGANAVTTTDDTDNKQQTRGSVRAADGVAPVLTGQNITGSNQVTITYSEAVTGEISDYTDLQIGNPLDGNAPDRTDAVPDDADLVPRNVMEVRGFGTSTHTITFIGEAAATNAVARIDIGGVKDISPKGNVFVGLDLVAGEGNILIADGQAPEVVSVMVTGERQITVQWSETITTNAADYVNLRVNGARNITAVAPGGGGSTDANNVVTDHNILLTFSGSMVNTSATGVITINPVDDTTVGNRADADTNKSALQPNIVVTDGQAPSLVTAVGDANNVEGLKITGPKTITLTANEAVSATDKTFSNLRIAGEGNDDEGNPITREITNVSVGGAIVTITFGGDEVDPNATASINVVNTRTDGNPDEDALVDLAGNMLRDIDPNVNNNDNELTVEDGQAPTLVSIGITDGAEVQNGTIRVEFSEPIDDATLGTSPDFAFSNLRISGESDERTINSVTRNTGDDTNVIIIEFAGIDHDEDPGTTNRGAAVDDTATIRIAGTITDEAGNSLEDSGSKVVSAAQAPFIKTIKITGDGVITAEFSEDLATATVNANGFQSLILRGESLPRDILTVDHPVDGDNTMVTITFDVTEDAGGSVDTDATATITINDSITDVPGTPFSETNMIVTDGQKPTLEVSITGPNQITAEFSEAVDAEKDHFDNLRIGGMADSTDTREITSFTSTSTTYVMNFDGPVVLGNGSGFIDIGEGITDNADNEYEGVGDPLSLENIMVSDGQLPTLESITITGENTVTVKFSEEVRADRNGFVAFQVLQNGVSVDDYRNIAVREPTQPTGQQTFADIVPTSTVVLNFSGNEAPLEATGQINITGEVKDASDNAFAAMTNVEIGASQIPSVASASVIDSNMVEIVFSEQLSATSADEDNFTGLTIDGEDEPRTITEVGLATETITITFDTSGPDGQTGTEATSADDNPAPTDATATIDITGVTDIQDNTIKDVTDQIVGDKQKPTIMEASVTGPEIVTVVFSEAVNAAQDQFDNLVIDGTARDITSFDATSETTYTMTFGGDTVDGSAAGTIDIGNAITDMADNVFDGTDPDAGQDSVSVTDGQVPTLVRAEFIAGSAIGFVFSEPVLSTADAYTELMILTDPVDPRNVILSGNADVFITVNYSGAPVPDGVSGMVSIDDSITDYTVDDQNTNVAGKMLAVTQAEILPRSVPTLVSADITGPNTITVVFSEPVTATTDHFTDLQITDEGSRNITEISGSGTDTITLTFSGRAVDAGATGTMNVVGDDPATTDTVEPGITDLVNRSFVLLENTPIAMGQNPSLVSAMITEPNTITLEFSETVVPAHNVILSDLFMNLMLYPGGERNIDNFDISGSTVTITFDGSGVDTDATGSMDIGSSLLLDTEGNPFAGAEDVTIQAGQPASLTSVSIASDGDDPTSANAGDKVTVTFTASETIARPDVTIHGSPADYVTNPAGDNWVAARTLQAGDADGTVTFTISFSGQEVSSTTDGSSVSFNVAPMVDSAAVTGSNEITVTFSKAVNASISDFTGLVLVPGGARTITGVAGSGTDTITLTFGGAASSTDATASLTVGSGVTDIVGTAFAGPLSVDASDGQAPTLVNVSISSDNADSSIAAVGDIVTLTFTASEALSSTDVIIDGVDPGASTDDSITWIATKTVTETDLGGAAVAFTIDYADMASNAGAQVNTTTDGSSVTIAQTSTNTATVTGTVFSDTNGNGVQNDGEAGISGYEMIAIDLVTNQTRMAVTASDGTYTFEGVRADGRTLIQTGFFPPGHTVVDVASSWFMYVEPEAGSTETFDVGFYPVPARERTTLNLTVYHDANINGIMDVGESGISGVMLTVYTYTIGPELVTTGPNGTLIKADLVPADWAITTIPEGYLPTAYSYERNDDTAGKVYDPAVLVADDPASGSVHTMMIGLVPAQ